MKVLKFGGSSLQPLELFLSSCSITVQQLTGTRGVVVVSALGGVTNQLQSALSLALSGEDFQTPLLQLKQQHRDRINELQTQLAHYDFTDCLNNMEQMLNDLEQLLKGILLVKDANERTQARVLAFGERLSSQLFFHSLNAQNNAVDIGLLDSANYIKTEGSFLEGSYLEESSNQLIQSIPLLPHQWFVAPGFVASNEDGDPTLLGRNGSDLSAAIYAAGLKADELQIWSDVDGIYNADPSRINQAQVVPQLSYNEAMELSYFGAKVLHPKTIAPIASHKIPTVIKNTLAPELPGTLIVEQSLSNGHTVAGITMLDNLAMINLSGVNLKGKTGLAERVFRCISREDISIVLISQSSSEYSISFCVQQKEVKRAKRALQKEFALEIKHQQVNPVDVREELASITVVGDQMKQHHGTAAKLFSALATANVNVVAIAQDSSERSISAIIRQAKAEVALRKTYEYFFECPRVISVILYGVGTIGGELIRQIQLQQDELLQQRIDLRIVAIANSKRLLWQPQGLSLLNWQEQLKQSELSSSIAQLSKRLQHECPLNPVFVDCTSSDALASEYVHLFEKGVHVVAANKKANTDDYDYYQKLRRAAQQSLRQFGYETNVGAGLPIIANIQNQVRSGDKLKSFSGILSGSLSFIMGKLEDGYSFSQAVIEAKAKGFTEPDPRDDLSGMDVARKLLIIAREFGSQAELDDVIIEPLLNDELVKAPNIDSFLQQLPSIDKSFAERQQKAQASGKVLRYAGTIEPNGQMAVKLIEVDRQHALYAIRDGENAFSFSTQRYHPVPMVIRGYGAGAEVTAAGVFGDILQTVVA